MTSLGSEISFRRDGETPFTVPQKRAVLRDARISLAARGLFQFLWDLPGNWRIRSGHLGKITGTGTSRLRSLFRELAGVGALALEPIRLSAEEAVARTEATGKKFKAGQIVGTVWKILHPDKWAVESPLSILKSPEGAPVADSTEMQETLISAFPSLGKSHPKVLQFEGSPNESPPTPRNPNLNTATAGLGKNWDLEKLVDATLRARATDDPPRNPAGWAIWARSRAAAGDFLPLEPGRRLLAAEAARAEAEARHKKSLAALPPDEPEFAAQGRAIFAAVRRKRAL